MGITIFLPSGKTFSFVNVTEFTSNETLVTFKYQSASSALSRRAVFYVSQISGVGRDNES